MAGQAFCSIYSTWQEIRIGFNQRNKISNTVDDNVWGSVGKGMEWSYA